MDNELLQQEARRYLDLAYASQMSGELDQAVHLYERSIDIWPTAEAHTYLGWTYSFMGRLESAIGECQRAIEIDPEFGNPYNDIGAYLIQLQRFEEAVHWLELACDAPRYENRHFAYFNLGRLRERFGEFRAALAAFDRAAALEPTYTSALQAAERIRAWMN